MAIISACPYDCQDSCSFVVEMRDGEPVVRGNPDHPFTRGKICHKGARWPKRLKSPERITTPLLRTKGGFTPISWDQSLELCARHINELRDTPERILHIRGHGYRGLFSQASIHFFDRLMTSRITGSLCDDAGIKSSIMDFGELGHNNPLDIAKAERIVNWGRDLNRSSLHLKDLVDQAREKGCQVLTISPGGDGAEKYASHVVRIKPGTDRFLACALIKAVLYERGHMDLFKNKGAKGFFSALDSHGLEELLGLCRVSTDDFRIVLDYYRQHPTATILAWGLQRYVHGGETIRFINALTFLSGNVGVSGGGVYYNISSSRNFDLTWVAPNAAERRGLPIYSLGRAIAQADPGIAMIWVDGHNVVNQAPDTEATAKAFEDCPFTVVVDSFMNDTALRADLVLPNCMALEKRDIIGSCMHNFLNLAEKVVDPPGQCRPDYEIIAELAGMLDDPVDMPDMEEMARLSLRQERFKEDIERLYEQGFLEGDWPEIAFEDLRDNPGKYCFPEKLTPPEPEDAAYPLSLLSLVHRDYIHSQMDEAAQQGLPRVWVHPDYLTRAGLDPEKPIFLATSAGRLQVRALTDPTLCATALVYRRDDWAKCGRGINRIIRPMVTDIGHTAAFYSQKARLEH